MHSSSKVTCWFRISATLCGRLNFGSGTTPILRDRMPPRWLYLWQELLAVLHCRPEPLLYYAGRLASRQRAGKARGEDVRCRACTRRDTGGRKGCKGKKPQVSFPCPTADLLDELCIRY